MKQTRFYLTNIPPPYERVILAGVLTNNDDEELFDVDLKEMKMLCATAGAVVYDTVVQKREAPTASTYIGKGKLLEICELMKKHNCQTLVIDAQLSPGQIRNIEKIVQAKIIDRAQLILDIFAKHAKTTEAKIQVELAQMKTLYPRLTHAWTHFSQQVGGIGTKGPGEKQLEVDRRLIKKRINELTSKLKQIEKSRSVQRKMRENMFKVTLIGYTNVGKSSLLNAMSKADVFVENRLFATLDTSTKRVYIPEYGEIIVSDTVGFLRKLPPHLVASFRGTLEVVCEADLLLIVMDASSSWSDQQLATVNQVLFDLNAHKIPHLLIFNKVDLVKDNIERKKLEVKYPDALLISAFSKNDIMLLKKRIAEIIKNYKREESGFLALEKKVKHLNRDPNAPQGLPWEEK